MVKRKLRLGRVFGVLLLLLLITISVLVGVFFYELSPEDKDAKEVFYEVESGMTVYQIYEDLEDKKIIRSALFMKLYSKLVGGQSVLAGQYKIGANMNTKDIFKTLKNGGKSSKETVTFVFKEGRNMRDLGSALETATSGNITKEAFLEKIKDKTYVKTLIDDYWFITDAVLDENIYYPLEGYLFPNTYEIYKDSTIEEVVEKMLSATDLNLTKNKEAILNSQYSVHELLTLASIVELESSNKSDRKDIAGVFINRLRDNWSLGSCVSTYYAFGINMGDRDLKMSEINDCTSNKYNTRCTSFIGLPVGPIGNPGEDSILATLNPNKHDYYYFLADKDMNTYFSKTEAEHNRKGAELRANGQMLYN